MLTGETMDMDTNQDWRDSLARDVLAMQVWWSESDPQPPFSKETMQMGGSVYV